jgi:hypothetical protein
MKEDYLLIYVRSLRLILNESNNNLLQFLQKLDSVHHDEYIMKLKITLDNLILLGDEYYQRIMISAREFLLRAIVLSNIKRYSLEILHLSDNIQYILDDIDDYNSSKSNFPGQSRRKLFLGIESFFIVVLRTSHAINVLHN